MIAAQLLPLLDLAGVAVFAITGVFGGVLRDVLCAEIPMILRKGNIYATAAIAGTLARTSAGTSARTSARTSVYVVLPDAGLARIWSAAAGMLAVAGLRLAAIIWNLSLPVFSIQRR